MHLEQQKRLFELHRKAHSVAFMHYIRKGCVPPELHEMLQATGSVQAFAKYNSDQARVPAGSPDGGQWTNGDSGGGQLTDSINPVYPIETLLTALSGGTVISAVRSLVGSAIRGLTGDVLGDAEKAIEDYLGGTPDRAFPNDAGDMILMRGDKKIRFDINNPGNDDPHFHIEQLNSDGAWEDAGDQHRYYFNED